MMFTCSCRRLGLALLAVLVLFSASAFVRAATFTVTKTADTNDGICDADCSLREAITAANANPGADTITLPAGGYTLSIAGANEDANATGDLDITDSVVINGAGAATTIVDGGAIDRVFHVIGGTSTISGVTIQNGLAPGASDGGGVFVVFSGTLTLTNVTLTNNHTSGGAGGGILNNGTATLTNCTVSLNGTAAGGDGGGLNNQNTMTITGTTITGNTTAAGGGNGAGVNNSADMTITGSAITGNDAGGGGNGGGIYNSSTITVDATPISGNAAGPAGGNGGGVYNSSDATTTNGSIDTNTTAGGGNGGGVYNSSSVTLTSTPVTGNTANGDGGGIYDIGLLATLTNITIGGNAAGPAGNGGGLYTASIGVVANGVTFSGNSAGGSGGAIYNNGEGGTLTNVTITGNTSPTPVVFNFGNTVNFVDSTIASNTGGGIQTQTGSTTTLTNTIIANNGTNCSGTGTTTNGGTNLQFPGSTCSGIPTADPLLQPLANNGGPTMTMALIVGSPAVDAGTTGCPPSPATDQRGIARPQGAGCDIGAFELQPGGGPTATPTLTPTATPTPTLTPTTGPGATPTPPPPPTVTRTQGPPPAATVPTLASPLLAVLAMLLAAAALFSLRKQA